MINLLPPEEKEELLLEKKKRITIIILVLTLFFLFCLVLILFANKIYLKNQVRAQKALLLEVKKELEQSEFQELRGKINLINQALKKLNPFYQQKIYFSGILERISKTLPQQIFLNNLSVTPSHTEEEYTVKISLSGFAPTREVLFAFKKNLEKEDDFKKIYFPPANWVKPTDIDFLVNFEIDIR